MSTDRTFNPDRPDNIDATRRVDAGGYGATIRATSSTIRATAMGGTVRSNGMVAPQDENEVSRRTEISAQGFISQARCSCPPEAEGPTA